jgi:hypothetical protein
MQTTYSWPSVIGTLLLLSACQDPTEPIKPDATEPIKVETRSYSNGDTECVGALTGPIFGNVVVPPGAACLLTGATVHGNVKAFEGSILNIFFESVVWGNVEGEKTLGFGVGESVVHGHIKKTGGGGIFIFLTRLPNGNIFIENSTGPTGLEDNTLDKGNVQVEGMVVGPLNITSNSVGGNVQLLKNTANDFTLGGNGIGGALQLSDNVALFDFDIANNGVGDNVQLFKNTGRSMSVIGNNVRGNLQCKENAVPLFVILANIVGGNTEDQCRPVSGEEQT